MTDFALIWNGATDLADFAVANGDLVLDNSLDTAVIISLGTDRLAAADDPLPDPRDPDRRGFWGDEPVDPSDGRKYPLGSRLWLLRRAKFSDRTPALAVRYVQEALQWLIDDGVAASVVVTVASQSQPLGTLLLGIQIIRNTPDRSGSRIYDTQWSVSV